MIECQSEKSKRSDTCNSPAYSTWTGEHQDQVEPRSARTKPTAIDREPQIRGARWKVRVSLFDKLRSRSGPESQIHLDLNQMVGKSRTHPHSFKDPADLKASSDNQRPPSGFILKALEASKSRAIRSGGSWVIGVVRWPDNELGEEIWSGTVWNHLIESYNAKVLAWPTHTSMGCRNCRHQFSEAMQGTKYNDYQVNVKQEQLPESGSRCPRSTVRDSGQFNECSAQERCPKISIMHSSALTIDQVSSLMPNQALGIRRVYF